MRNSTSRISAIIPVYNNEAFIAEAIDSVLAQEPCPCELIVIDDGSTDQTAERVAEYGDRVRYIRQDNQGPAAARNHGLREAKGDLVALLDADDLWAPGKLAAQLRYLDAHPEVAAVIGKIQHFIQDGAEATADYRQEWLENDLVGYHFGTLLARKSVFERVGGMNSEFKYTDDVDWFLRLKDQKIELGIVDQVVMLKRLHGDSITNRQQEQNQNLLLALRRSLKRRKEDG